MAYALGAHSAPSVVIRVANNIPNMMFELVAGGVLSSRVHPDLHRAPAARRRGGRLAVRELRLQPRRRRARASSPSPGRSGPSRSCARRRSRDPASRRGLAPGAFLFRFFAVQIVFYGVGAVVHRHAQLAPALPRTRRRRRSSTTSSSSSRCSASTSRSHATRPRQLAKIVLGVGTTLGVVVMADRADPEPRQGSASGYTPSIDWRHPALRSDGRARWSPTLVYVVTNLVGVSFRNAYAFAAAPDGVGRRSCATRGCSTSSRTASSRSRWRRRSSPSSPRRPAPRTERVQGAIRGPARNGRAHDAHGRDARRARRAAGDAPTPPDAFTGVRRPVRSRPCSRVGVGLFSFAAYMFTLQAFYSLQDTRTPMITNVFATSCRSACTGADVGVGAWRGRPAGHPARRRCDLLRCTSWSSGCSRRRKSARYGVRPSASSLLPSCAWRRSIAGGAAAWGVSAVARGFVSGLRLGFLAQLVLAESVGLSLTYGLARADARTRDRGGWAARAARLRSRFAARRRRREGGRRLIPAHDEAERIADDGRAAGAIAGVDRVARRRRRFDRRHRLRAPSGRRDVSCV